MQPLPTITSTATTGGRRADVSSAAPVRPLPRRPIPPSPSPPPPPPPPPPRRPLPPQHAHGPALAPDCVTITPWIDPIVDPVGHDPRSHYVERFWLSTLGPTATWLLRRLVDGFDQHPDGYVLDLAVTAQSLGLTYTRGQSSPFGKAFHRCVMFGLAHQCATGYAVRRRIPDVARRHILRMPDELRRAHEAWDVEAAVSPPGVTAIDAAS